MNEKCLDTVKCAQRPKKRDAGSKNALNCAQRPKKRDAGRTRASGGSTNHWTEPIECQIVANLDLFFSVTLLKHFCQSVSFYYWKDNINIVQYKYCFYLCENEDV